MSITADRSCVKSNKHFVNCAAGDQGVYKSWAQPKNTAVAVWCLVGTRLILVHLNIRAANRYWWTDAIAVFPSVRPSFSFSAGWETLSHAKRRDYVSVQGRPVLNQYHCTEITALYQPATWDRLRVSRRFAERAVWDGTRTWLEAHHQCPLIFNSPPFSPSLISLKNPCLLPALLQYRCPSAEHGANLPCVGFFFFVTY